jgi:hypothetical protein
VALRAIEQQGVERLARQRARVRRRRTPGRHARLECAMARPQRDGAHFRAGRRVELRAQAKRTQELDAGRGNELAAHLAARELCLFH